MSKIKYLDKAIKEALDSLVILQEAGRAVDSADIRNMRARITDKVSQALQTDKAEYPYYSVNHKGNTLPGAQKEKLSGVADRIGVDIDKKRPAKYNTKQELKKMQGDIKWAAGILRNYINATGGINMRYLERDYPNDANYLLRMKDLMDRLAISYLYDPKNFDKTSTQDERFGIQYKRDENGNIIKDENGAPVGFDDSKFDITQASDKKILDWSKEGTSQASGGRGYDSGRTDAENVKAAKPLYYAQLVDKYFTSKYGYQLEIPKTSFTIGNNKLPNDTLVINFTSAHRCPAWNECLVKYACYARGSEHGYKDLFRKNTNLNLMWEAARRDPELMELLKQYIRVHLVSYTALSSFLKKEAEATRQTIRRGNNDGTYDFNYELNPDTQYVDRYAAVDAGTTKAGKQRIGRQKMSASISDDAKYADYPVSALSKIPFDQFSERTRNFIMGNAVQATGLTPDDEEEEEVVAQPQEKKQVVLRATKVRLNEEGDFIGQWLVDAIDEFAGELKVLGIATTAYTCRNLNFEKVKNIIINASRTFVGRGENGEVADAIARYFYAVPAKMYDGFAETYENQEGDISSPSFVVDENGERHIVPKPLPLFDVDTGRPNGKFYYKCPCERTTDAQGNIIQGLKKRDNQSKDITKQYYPINCFDCRTCYQPKAENLGGQLFVLVRLHGNNIQGFDEKLAAKAREDLGVAENYLPQAQQEQQMAMIQKESKAMRQFKYNMLCEELEDAGINVEDEAIKSITQHGIDSMNQKLSRIAAGGLTTEGKETKKQFNLIMERLKKADKILKN